MVPSTLPVELRAPTKQNKQIKKTQNYPWSRASPTSLYPYQQEIYSSFQMSQESSHFSLQPQPFPQLRILWPMLEFYCHLLTGNTLMTFFYQLVMNFTVVFWVPTVCCVLVIYPTCLLYKYGKQNPCPHRTHILTKASWFSSNTLSGVRAIYLV